MSVQSKGERKTSSVLVLVVLELKVESLSLITGGVDVKISVAMPSSGGFGGCSGQGLRPGIGMNRHCQEGISLREGFPNLV